MVVRQIHHELSCAYAGDGQTRIGGWAGESERWGQAVVEFALAIPLLMVLILGVFDAGRGVVALTSVANAAREGARHGAIAYAAPTWQTDAETRARATGWSLDQAQLTVTVSAATVGGSTYVDVLATYNFRPVVPGVTVLMDPVPLTANVRMLASQT